MTKRVKKTEQNKVHFQTEMDSCKTPLKLEDEVFLLNSMSRCSLKLNKWLLIIAFAWFVNNNNTLK